MPSPPRAFRFRSILLVATFLTLSARARAQGPPGEVPPTVAYSPYEARYHDADEVRGLLEQWTLASRGRVRWVSLPASAGGRAVPAIEFGARGAPDVPLEERPTVLLVGGLDGVSLSGCEAVLSLTHGLLERLDDLRGDVCFLVVPWASPDGLSATLESAEGSAGRGSTADGRNARPVDDDGDGVQDEDPPEDLDGDGYLLEMLLEDPAGAWARARDPRFLMRARPGDAPRYRRTLEGLDDDGDGRFNEDALGGVELDLSFPVGWRGPRADHDGLDARSGSLPLAEPVARALADLVLARDTVCVLSFQGSHGEVARPGGSAGMPWPEDADGEVYASLARGWSWDRLRRQPRAAGGALTLREAWGVERPGAFLDWAYAVRGCLALEIAVWGPPPKDPQDERLSAPRALPQRTGPVPLGEPVGTQTDWGSPAGSVTRPGMPFVPRDPLDDSWVAGRTPDIAVQDWIPWLDDERGGMGFVDWHAVEIGGGRQALVGGFLPRTVLNPPDDCLPAALSGIDRFLQRVLDALPALGITVEVLDLGEGLVSVRSTVENHGALPTALAVSGRAAGDASKARLTLRELGGNRVLFGEREVPLGVLPGGGRSHELEWIVFAPDGLGLELVVDAPCAARIERVVGR